MENEAFTSFVLTIHFHSVRGYVGNRALVFPLQALGRHVDHLEAVQFTCLYIKAGQILQSGDTRKVLQTLPLVELEPRRQLYDQSDLLQRRRREMEASHPIRYRFILTGYMGSGDNLMEFVRFIRHHWRLTRQGRKFGSVKEMIGSDCPLWVCDPVMGDNGIIYVQDELPDKFRSEAIPLADIMLPNQTELECLCGREEITSIEEAFDCCRELHDRGVIAVVVTSMVINKDEILVLGSERCHNGDKQFCIRVPHLDVYLVGTGDLFSAIFIDELQKTKGCLHASCQKAARVTHGVIKTTMANGVLHEGVDVVTGRDEILNPTANEFPIEWF